MSIVITVCSRPRYALADKRRPTRSGVSQKNTLPFKSRYHSEGVIPLRHFRNAVSLIGFWSLMTAGPYLTCRIVTDSGRRQLSIRLRSSPLISYMSKSALVLKSPCSLIDCQVPLSAMWYRRGWCDTRSSGVIPNWLPRPPVNDASRIEACRDQRDWRAGYTFDLFYETDRFFRQLLKSACVSVLN